MQHALYVIQNRSLLEVYFVEARSYFPEIDCRRCHENDLESSNEFPTGDDNQRWNECREDLCICTDRHRDRNYMSLVVINCSAVSNFGNHFLGDRRHRDIHSAVTGKAKIYIYQLSRSARESATGFIITTCRQCLKIQKMLLPVRRSW